MDKDDGFTRYHAKLSRGQMETEMALWKNADSVRHYIIVPIAPYGDSVILYAGNKDYLGADWDKCYTLDEAEERCNELNADPSRQNDKLKYHIFRLVFNEDYLLTERDKSIVAGFLMRPPEVQ